MKNDNDVNNFNNNNDLKGSIRKKIPYDYDKYEGKEETQYSRLDFKLSIQNNFNYFRYAWYDVEFRRLIYYFIWLVIAFYFTGVTNSFADNKGTILDKKHSTLYDSGFIFVDYIFTKKNLNLSSDLPNTLLTYHEIVTAIYVYLFHKGMRVLIYQRWLYLLAIIFSIRSLCLALTVFPLPEDIVLPYNCYTYHDVFYAPFKIAFMGYVNCHDFFFSGHTANAICCVLIIVYYSKFLILSANSKNVNHYHHNYNYIYKYHRYPRNYRGNNSYHKEYEKNVYFKYNNINIFVDNNNKGKDHQKLIFFYFIRYILVAYIWLSLIAIVLFLLYFKQHYSIDCLMGFALPILFFVINEYEMEYNTGIYYFFGRLPSCLPHEKRNRSQQNYNNNRNYNYNPNTNNNNVGNVDNYDNNINNKNVSNRHYREYYDKNDDHDDGRQSIPVLHDNDSDNENNPNVVINVNDAENHNNNHNNHDANGYQQ